MNDFLEQQAQEIATELIGKYTYFQTVCYEIVKDAVIEAFTEHGQFKDLKEIAVYISNNLI